MCMYECAVCVCGDAGLQECMYVHIVRAPFYLDTNLCRSCNDVLVVTRGTTSPVDLMLVSYILSNYFRGM